MMKRRPVFSHAHTHFIVDPCVSVLVKLDSFKSLVKLRHGFSHSYSVACENNSVCVVFQP